MTARPIDAPTEEEAKEAALAADNIEDESTVSFYELLMVLKPGVRETEREKEITEIKALIKEYGGDIKSEEVMGERDLAYRIKKQNKGYYVVFQMDLEREKTKALNEAVKLYPGTLRHILVVLPENYDKDQMKKSGERLAKYLEKLRAAKTKKKNGPAGQSFAGAATPRRPAQVVMKAKEEEPTEDKPSTDEAPKAPTMISGETEKEKLESVEKKLEDILDNPDIAL